MLDDRIACEVSSFFLGQYPVSQVLWEQVMGENPSSFRGNEALPIESVSWYGAVEFCNQLSEMRGLKPVYKIDKSKKDSKNTSKYDDLKWTVRRSIAANGYRLPTEAEREYAARGGKYARKTEYAGSDQLKEVGWFGYRDNAHIESQIPGLRIPNELGIYDLSGNVWEWCQDWYGSYSDTPMKDPLGPASGSGRVCAGGLGSAAQTTVALPAVATFAPITATSSMAFVSPGRSFEAFMAGIQLSVSKILYLLVFVLFTFLRKHFGIPSYVEWGISPTISRRGATAPIFAKAYLKVPVATRLV